MTDSPLRLRVFAGPNGSGKSTIIDAVSKYKINARPVDFGIYLNADDIAKQLKTGSVFFKDYKINVTNEEFANIAIASGLVNDTFTPNQFVKSFLLQNNQLQLKNKADNERIAQIITDFSKEEVNI